MTSLRLTLFGLPRIERDGVPVEIARRKALALLAYLALSPTPQSREHLAELLWPERDRASARADLRSSLFILTRAIGPGWLDAGDDAISLRRVPGLSVDIVHFHALLSQAIRHAHPATGRRCDSCASVLAEAVRLYTADFLAGFSLSDAAEFDNWQRYQTEGLRLDLAEALERLASLLTARGDHVAAIAHARRWLDLDPYCEEPHRALMQIYAEAGNRASAFRQYEECVRVLDEELGVRPDAETVALYEALAAGHGEHPRMVAAASPPLALPSDRTPFIGRETELSELAARLADPACRLLTVLGPGGSGKTRLAVTAARAQAGQHTDGIFFVDLAPVESADLLAPAIARALAAPSSGSGDSDDQLIAYLRDRHVLLVLDNFEHLMAGVGFLPRLLDAAPGVKLLVTSRARLGLVEEWLLPLEGMVLPPENVTPAVLEEFSATGLFLACAHRLRPGYRPAPGEAADIARVCRLLEGMPLGIELAAARTRTLPVGAIVTELARGLDVLETTMRDMPERHRSMAAAFDASWRLLIRHERHVLRCASVFRGGFTTEAAGVVADATLADLDGLVDSSWLRVEPGGRWGMHELIRQYCEGKLRTEHESETGENETQVRDRHARYYYTYLLAKQDVIDVDARVTEEIEPAFVDIAAAWERLAELDDFEAVHRSIWVFNEMIDRLAWWDLGMPLILRIIGRFEQADAAGLGGSEQQRRRNYTRAALWSVYGWDEDVAGRRRAALACYDRATALITASDPDDFAWAQVNLGLHQNRGILEFECGDFARSRARFLDNLDRVQRAKMQIWPGSAGSRPVWEAMSCYMIAINSRALGEYDVGLTWARRSVAAIEAYHPESPHKALCSGTLAILLMATGDYMEAEQHLKAGLRAATGAQYSQMIASLLCDLARLYLVWNRPEQSRAWGRRAATFCEDSGNFDALHSALCSLAGAEMSLGQVSEARQLCQKSLSLCEQPDAIPDNRYADSALGLGRVALAEETSEIAAAWARRALAAPAQTADTTTQAMLLMAEILRSQEQAERATELLAFVAKSPLAWHATRQKALAALTELESALPPDTYADAVARGEGRNRDDLLAELLAETTATP
jgi:DNA-binding SARP family transcriptional activator